MTCEQAGVVHQPAVRTMARNALRSSCMLTSQCTCVYDFSLLFYLMRDRDVMQGLGHLSRIPECVSPIPAHSTKRDFKEKRDRIMIASTRGSARRLWQLRNAGNYSWWTRIWRVRLWSRSLLRWRSFRGRSVLLQQLLTRSILFVRGSGLRSFARM